MLVYGFKCNSPHLVLICGPCQQILWEATMPSSDAYKHDPPFCLCHGVHNTHQGALVGLPALVSHCLSLLSPSVSSLPLPSLSYFLFSFLFLCIPTWCHRDTQMSGPQCSEVLGKWEGCPYTLSPEDTPYYHLCSRVAFPWQIQNWPAAWWLPRLYPGKPETGPLDLKVDFIMPPGQDSFCGVEGDMR